MQIRVQNLPCFVVNSRIFGVSFCTCFSAIRTLSLSFSFFFFSLEYKDTLPQSDCQCHSCNLVVFYTIDYTQLVEHFTTPCKVHIFVIQQAFHRIQFTLLLLFPDSEKCIDPLMLCIVPQKRKCFHLSWFSALLQSVSQAGQYRHEDFQLVKVDFEESVVLKSVEYNIVPYSLAVQFNGCKTYKDHVKSLCTMIQWLTTTGCPLTEEQ